MGQTKRATTGLRLVKLQNLKQATEGGVIVIPNDPAPIKNLSPLCFTVHFLFVSLTYLIASSMACWLGLLLRPGFPHQLIDTDSRSPEIHYGKHCRWKCKYNAHNHWVTKCDGRVSVCLSLRNPTNVNVWRTCENLPKKKKKKRETTSHCSLWLCQSCPLCFNNAIMSYISVTIWSHPFLCNLYSLSITHTHTHANQGCAPI